jgi:hypothetical protein
MRCDTVRPDADGSHGLAWYANRTTKYMTTKYEARTRRKYCTLTVQEIDEEMRDYREKKSHSTCLWVYLQFSNSRVRLMLCMQMQVKFCILYGVVKLHNSNPQRPRRSSKDNDGQYSDPVIELLLTNFVFQKHDMSRSIQRCPCCRNTIKIAFRIPRTELTVIQLWSRDDLLYPAGHFFFPSGN